MLQGFPRGYTKISDKTPDGPRYKALGNSFAVPVVKWIGEQIETVEKLIKKPLAKGFK
jgi:DNA (cytosine-5)-methyltransferase 1